MFKRSCVVSEELSRSELAREIKMWNPKDKDSCALVGGTFEFVDESLMEFTF